MWWEEGKLSFQARAFLNELMKFASIIIFNLGAKFSLHCMKSWCCDATKETHEPSTLITTSLYNSQIPVSNPLKGGYIKSESTEELSIYGTQSPWQLQICPPISQAGEKIQVYFHRKPLLRWIHQEAARSPTSHVCQEYCQGHPGADTQLIHHCWLWALLREETWAREEMALKHLSVRDLPLLQHPLPFQEQQMLLDWLSWRADPRLGKGSQSWAPQKATPKTKMFNHPSPNPWVWQRNEASEMQERRQTCSFSKHPLPSLCSSAQLLTGLHLADASISLFWANPHYLAAFRSPESAQSIPALEPCLSLLCSSCSSVHHGSGSVWAPAQQRLHPDRHSMAGKNLL